MTLEIKASDRDKDSKFSCGVCLVEIYADDKIKLTPRIMSWDLAEKMMFEFTESKLNLVCQYTKSNLMKIPVIGSRCLHYNITFCLEAFLELQDKKTLWKCPTCKLRTVTFQQNPIIYSLIQTIREQGLDTNLRDLENISVF